MNLSQLLPSLATNAETALLGVALHSATTGKIDLKHLDVDAMAISIFSLASQVEREHPGTAEKYGWAQISDLQQFQNAIGQASAATPPAGLQS